MSNQFGFDFDLGPTRFIRPEERESAAPDLGEFWKQSLQDRLNVSNIAGGHVKTAHEAFAEIDDDLFQATGSRLPSLDRTTPEDWSVEYGKLREKHPDRLPWATQQEFDIELSRRANEKIKSTRERMSEMSQQAGMIEA
ncbi:MAG: hypothetical protein IT533_09995, partial [Hyphomicrobiales bacterium]|nr:hypothetical protein [Hyphomicrobiales bacterium]